MTKPLDPYSMVVDERRRWDPEWYGWIQDLEARMTSAEARITALETTVAGFRIPFTANRIFDISPSGSDSTGDGSVAKPWKTLQFAWDQLVGKYDTKGFTASIRMAAGTYNAGLFVKVPWDGGGQVVIVGNGATPADTLLDINAPGPTGGHVFYIDCVLPSVLTIANIKIQTNQGGCTGILHNGRGYILVNSVNFGPCPAMHLYTAVSGGLIQIGTGAGYAISGTGHGQCHMYSAGGTIQVYNVTCTVNNVPSFSSGFAVDTGNSAKIETITVTYVDQAGHGRLGTTGTSVGGSAIITAIPSTANLTVGMVVVGTNIPAGAKILTIDSGTQITMDVNATGANGGLKFEIARGNKFVVSLQGGINTNGAGLDYYPGDVAGFANAAQFALYT